MADHGGNKFKLMVYTPEKAAIEENVEMFTAPGEEGEFGVLAGHSDLLSALKPGVLSYLSGGRTKYYAIDSGFAEVGPEHAVVLVSTIEQGDAIDPDEAKERIVQAEAALAGLAIGEEGYLERERAVDAARARLSAAKLSGGAMLHTAAH